MVGITGDDTFSERQICQHWFCLPSERSKKVKIWCQQNWFKVPIELTTDRSKAGILVLFLLNWTYGCSLRCLVYLLMLLVMFVGVRRKGSRLPCVLLVCNKFAVHRCLFTIRPIVSLISCDVIVALLGNPLPIELAAVRMSYKIARLQLMGSVAISVGQRRVWSDSADTQADLNFSWAHML